MAEQFPNPDLYIEDRFRPSRAGGGSFFCDNCGLRWPLGHRRLQIDAPGGASGGGTVYVGFCCYEPEGSTIDRDVRRAWAAGQVALLSARELHPPMGPDNAYYPGNPSPATGSLSWITGFSRSPIVMIAGGASVTLTLTGVGFSAADTFAYGSVGITDAGDPQLTGTTQWDLLVQADISTTPGRYRLVFNIDIWQNVFEVR